MKSINSSKITVQMNHLSLAMLVIVFYSFSKNIYAIEMNNGIADDIKLEEIKVGGVLIDKFSSDTYVYHQYLPYNTSQVPLVTAKVSGSTSLSIKQARSLIGSESERTAVVSFKTRDGSKTRSCKVTFEIMPKLDLYLCIGQSNMAGRGVMIPESGDLNVIDKAWLFTQSGNWEIASNPLNKYSEVRKNIDLQQISPVFSFVTKIIEETGNNVGLIVNARGGTKIESWLKGHSSGYYASTIRRALEAQKWGDFKGILWHQGEGNSQLHAIPRYPEQLSVMVADYRADLNNENLFFCAGQLAQWYTNPDKAERMNLFNSMLDSISTFIPFSSYVISDGLKPINNDYDDPHFDRESQLILGERYARVVLRYVYRQESNAQSSSIGCD
jgi:hypothetical protein